MQKENNSYRYFDFLIAAFCLAALVQFGSGLMIFSQSIGWSIEAITSYYSAHSFERQIKIVVPHLLAYSLTIFTLLHFFMFMKPRRAPKLLCYILVASALGEISFGFLIGTLGWPMAYLKLISLIVFELSLFYCCFIIIKSAVSPQENS